jgi:MFS family permease
VTTLVDETGTGMYLTGSVLFFTHVVGLSATEVGLGLSIAGIVSLFAGIPIGRAADKYGARRVLVLLSLTQALLFASYLLVDGFAGFLLVVCLVAAAEAGASPVRKAYISTLTVPEERVTVAAYNRAVFNVAFSLGALISVFALAAGTRTAYQLLVLGNGATFLVAAVLQMLQPRSRRRSDIKPPPRRWAVLGDRPFILLAATVGLTYVHTQVLTVGLPLWVALETSAPTALVSGLLLLNTAIAVLFQVRLSRGVDSVPNAAIAVRRAGVALLLACLVFALSGSVGVSLAILALLVGTALLTVGELWSSAGSWGLSFELSPESRQAEYLAAFSLGESLAQVVGPVLITSLVIGVGAGGWCLLGALFLALGLGAVPASAWADRTRHMRTPAEAPDSRLINQVVTPTTGSAASARNPNPS